MPFLTNDILQVLENANINLQFIRLLIKAPLNLSIFGTMFMQHIFVYGLRFAALPFAA